MKYFKKLIKKDDFWKALGAIMLLGVIVYYAVDNNKLESQIKKQKITSDKIVTSSGLEPDQNGMLAYAQRNYTDSSPSFRLKYPKNWHMYRFPVKGFNDEIWDQDSTKHNYNYVDYQGRTYRELVFIQKDKEDYCGGESCAPGAYANAFVLGVQENKDNLDYQQLVAKEEGEMIPIKSEPFQIAGKEGIKLWEDCEGSIGCNIPKWYLIDRGYIYSFLGFSGYANDDESVKNKIRDSFELK